jgi:DNA-directed RNA polymerase specialized sigma24 family protein
MARDSLRLDPRMLWHDDVEQAGRIALWEKSPANVALAYTVARHAMVDEIRRTRYGARSIHAGEHVSWVDARDDKPGYELPERLLAVKQAVGILMNMPPQYQAVVSAVLECDTKDEAAKRVGLHPSRITQMLTHQRLDDRRCVAARLSEAL